MKSLSIQPLSATSVSSALNSERSVPELIGEMQHPVLARFDLAGVDGHGAARVDDDDAGPAHAARPAAASFFLSTEVPRRFGTQ